MKIAVIQFNAKSNKAKNIHRALMMIERAARHGAECVCLPELFVFRGKAAEIAKNAETIPGPTTRLLSLVAQRRCISILAGSIYEHIARSSKAYNTSVLLSPEGAIEAKYRKMHLFRANVYRKPINEAKYFKPGGHIATADVGHFKAGLSVCYDVRFPLLYHAYAHKGAELFFIPSSFTKETGRAHWETLCRARAIENGCYVIAPNQVGKNAQGIPSYGNSLVVDPWGKVVARASSNKEQILYAVCDKKAVRTARKKLPGLKT